MPITRAQPQISESRTITDTPGQNEETTVTEAIVLEFVRIREWQPTKDQLMVELKKRDVTGKKKAQQAKNIRNYIGDVENPRERADYDNADIRKLESFRLRNE